MKPGIKRYTTGEGTAGPLLINLPVLVVPVFYSLRPRFEDRRIPFTTLCTSTEDSSAASFNACRLIAYMATEVLSGYLVLYHLNNRRLDGFRR